MNKPKSVDSYIKSAPNESKEKLIELRKIIKSTAPKAEEKISYGMPYYNYKGQLAYFAFAKHHIGLYIPPPVMAEHRNELKNYETAKATVRFPLTHKLPSPLIKKLIKSRLMKNEEKSKRTIANSKISEKNYVKYHRNGSIWAKGTMIKNTPEGYWEWFRKGGTIMRSGYFKNGKQSGKWTTFDQKGKVYKVTDFGNQK